MTRPVLRVSLVVGLAVAFLAPAPVQAEPRGESPHDHCARMHRLEVPGAERQKEACLDDLTTSGTITSGHTDPRDWAGLHARGTRNPTGVPGVQIDGYFPDTSAFNSHNGWNHDAQFVMRLPDDWNGGLVVTGAPGTRTQYANDFTISDWALARGYAFVSTDKGNSGARFYRDGRTPADAIAEWHRRVTELAVAAKDVVGQRYREPVRRTYVTGISNGGYLTRWQLENHPELYDGGVDWEGTLMGPQEPNLFTYLPVALRNYPAYRATGDRDAHSAMIEAGFAPGSEFLWEYHYAAYWDLTQRIYREEIDPAYDGELEAGIPFCRPGTPRCDSDYDYSSRPEAVREALEEIELTGDLGKPMLTVHGTLDALLPIATDSDAYAKRVAVAGQGERFGYYRIEGGNHVDGLYDTYPDRLRPILPCYRDAFVALEQWVEDGVLPPKSTTVPKPASGDVVNSCSLAS